MYSKQKGFASVILILVVILGVVGFFAYSNRTNLFKTNPNTLEGEQTISNSLRVEGDSIYDGSKKLFDNVSGVASVRYGPDKKTLHFQLVQDAENLYSCVVLDNLQSGTNPWDFRLIGQNVTLPACANGYLKRSPYFAYIKITGGTVSLILEDTAKKIRSISVGNVVTKEKLDKNINSVGGISSLDDGNGNTFVYPWKDSYIVDGKIILAFGNAIVGVDIEKGMALGYLSMSDTPYVDSGGSTNFWFESDKNIPLVLINASWEGPLPYQAIVDFSGQTLQVTPLVDKDKSGNNVIGLRKFAWENGGLDLTLYEEIDVTHEVSDITSKLSYDNFDNTKQYDEADAKAKAFLMKKYEHVVCTLSPGIVEGCFAGINLTHYRYEPGGPLKKV